MRFDNFTKNNIIMFCANSLGSFFNLLYQIIMLRLLSKEAFASLNSLISLLAVLSVPALSFATMVTKHISSHNALKKDEHLKTLWQRLLCHAFIFSLGIFLLLFFLRFQLAEFFHIGSPWSIVILGAIFFFSGIASVVTGGLQGLEKFKWLAIIGVLAGVLKILLPIGLVRLFASSLNAALVGFLLPGIFGIAFALWPLRFLLSKANGQKVNLKQLYLYIIPVSLVSLCFALLTNIDMILVKHFFLQEAQDYSVAQMIGKIVLSISGMVYVVMFSRAANMHAVKEDTKSILKKSLGFTFFLTIIAVSFFNLFPHFVFSLIAGRVNPQVIFLSRIFSLSMFFFALCNVLFYYQLSIERYSFILPLILIGLLEAAAMGTFHKTTVSVTVIALICSMALFGINLYLAFASRPHRQ